MSGAGANQEGGNAAKVASDIELIGSSGMFDRDFYRTRAALDAAVDPIEHYVRWGWQLGLEPNEDFEGGFLGPYFQTIGLDDPPLVTFLILRASGWLVHPSRAHAEWYATIVRDSGLLDEEDYAFRNRLPAGMDPALHYVIVGELAGFAPSDRFDPVFYGRRYPDLRAASLNYLVHYAQHGRQEQRRPVSTASKLPLDASRLDPGRETILVVSHQASRTGAPILAYNVIDHLRVRYNVVTLLLGDGALLNDFVRRSSEVIGPLDYMDWHEVEADDLVARLSVFGRISYALVNSSESRSMVAALVKGGVPVVFLVHEFALYVYPKGALGEALEWATQMVFSADMTARSALQELPSLTHRDIDILHQGRCVVPGAQQMPASDVASLRKRIRPEGLADSFVVLGCGTVEFRKGVDLFLACAASVKALKPRRPVRFVWVGRGYDPVNDVAYSTYLAEQIARSDLADAVEMIDEVPDLAPVYEMADVFFLSSRLDPLPNVTIDAVSTGLPVLCFDGGSGMASLMKQDPSVSRCVLPYLDIHAAAGVILELASDGDALATMGRATRSFGARTFDMGEYVSRIDQLGRRSIDVMAQRVMDFETISNDPSFDSEFYIPSGTMLDRSGAVQDFLTRWSARGATSLVDDLKCRKPFAGFNPRIYAAMNADCFDSRIVNPLAHFIRSGKPEGAWLHPVITLASGTGEGLVPPAALLHAHLQEPGSADDLRRKLAVNRSPCDLWLTTTDDATASRLTSVFSSYRQGTVDVRVVPDRGRDLGALFSGLDRSVLEKYDVVGHLHDARNLSPGDPTTADIGRELLWQKLAGDCFPMMDVILAEFAAVPQLGLVFPEAPHLTGRTAAFDSATGLAQRLGLNQPLDPFVDFPAGAMFWARTKALAPLLGLGLDWTDDPQQPLADEGAILRALARLLPAVVRHGGFEYRTTDIPGLSR